MLMTDDQYADEIARLTEGRLLVIDGKERRWWETRLRNGFFFRLEEDEFPVKVVVQGHVYYFNTGLTRQKVAALMREVFPKITVPVQTLEAIC